MHGIETNPDAMEGEVTAMDREERLSTVPMGADSADRCVSEGREVKLRAGGESTPPESNLCIPRTVAVDGDVTQEIAPSQVIEALLFSADTPIPGSKLAEAVGTGTARDVRACIEVLNAKYAEAGLSFRIEEIAKGYQMLTLPVFRPWLAKLHEQRSQTRLSGAALETLAIVAYKQPVIRADIEAVRGVGCGEVLNRLREMGLVRIIGRAEIVGRPMLYGTTRKFLDVFGLGDLDDLPPMDALMFARRAAKPDEQTSDANQDDTPPAAEPESVEQIEPQRIAAGA